MIKSKLQRLFLNLLIVSLASCGYHTAQPEDKTTISIPYVKGDEQGELTAEIIRELDQSGLYEFVRDGGELLLSVNLVGDKNDIIGWKYNRSEKKGKKEDNLMATENRRILCAEITLKQGDKVVLGPVKVSSSTDYDYIDVNSLKELTFINPHGKREKVLRLSLGQLDSIEGAQDASLNPLYRHLAQKIILTLEKAHATASDD